MLLLIDSFDSFTYMLKDYLEQEGVSLDVVRNDVHPREVDFSLYQGVVLSPGPESPEKAGYLMDYLKEIEKVKLPVLGICLGMQAINLHFGGKLRKCFRPMHGKLSDCTIKKSDSIFTGIPESFKIVRYHSLQIDHIPEAIIPLAEAGDDFCPMIIKHFDLPWYGIQYHPESILTDFGHEIIHNWLEISGILKEKC